MNNGWRSLGVDAAVIVLLTVLAYMPAMHAGFVWDDYYLITENRMVKASDGPYRFWFTAEAADYYPVIWSFWWLEWRLWDGRPAAYHVVNVLLHAVNAVLVWTILRRLKIPGAWLAGLIFAVHPVNVATVAWISEQKNTLSMLFYALSILLYLRFDEEERHRQGRFGFAQHRRLCHWRIWGWYGLSLTAGLLALLSKTAVVMLPVVLLGCLWWRHGKVRWKDWLRTAPFFVASLVLGLVTIVLQYQRALGEVVVRTGGVAARLAAAGWVPWFYLYKALLPVDLMLIYPNWKVDASRSISWLPGLALVGCFALFWWKRRTWGQPLLFGLGYFVVTLFPVLGFFDQGFYRLSLVSDHFQYYSIAGVIALAVAGGQWICGQMDRKGWRVGVPAPLGAGLISGAGLVLLTVATWSRAGVYREPESLWRDSVTRNPKAWAAHYNLGATLSKAGRVQEAIAHYEDALRLNPDYAQAHDNLGAALWQLGRTQEAIGHYERALKITPDYPAAHNNLGLALMRAGKIDEAIGHYQHALRIMPDFAEAHYGLGVALERTGKLEEAIDHYEQALRLRPDYAAARNRLARLRSVR